MLLPAVTSAQVIRALHKAGFVERQKKGRDLTLWNPVTGARAEIHAGPQDEQSVRSILKAAHVGIREFLGLVAKPKK